MKSTDTMVKEKQLIDILKKTITSTFENAEWNGNSCSTQLLPFTVLISVIPAENTEYFQIVVTFITALNISKVTTSHIAKLGNLDGKVKLNSKAAISAVNDLNSYTVSGKYSIRWKEPILYQYSLSLYINEPISKENLLAIVVAGKHKAENGYEFLKEKM